MIVQIVFEPNLLIHRKLPTLHYVLCYYFYLKASRDYDQKLVDHDITLDVMNHSISCNVYQQSHTWFQKQLKEVFAKFEF